jgi:hypothetical protein
MCVISPLSVTNIQFCFILIVSLRELKVINFHI